ncbi:MAG: ParB/RepB/Spo0J family partition protein [Thermodesulfobacteriota bacterium]|nr:ParB/RepB/Spo0J family partition protein [Thermodesulfobacteriota bacterium]
MGTKKNQKSTASQQKKRKKMALGKGIGALIPGFDEDEFQRPDFFLCEIDRIHPNRYQPRKQFKDEELGELARSIETQGILQPLLIRPDTIDYELVAGERRLRAAKIAGLTEVPVLLKDISDTNLLETAIIENIQREDLNPLEEAEAYHRLMAEFDLTQDQTAERVGKSRSAVANFLRLRQLPDIIKASIVDDRLSMGHARALLGCENKAQQQKIWQEILKKGLSVRQTEALIKRLKTGKKQTKNPTSDPERVYFSGLAEGLSRDLGTKVHIDRRGKKGTVKIEFYGDDDLDRLIEQLRR